MGPGGGSLHRSWTAPPRSVSRNGTAQKPRVREKELSKEADRGGIDCWGEKKKKTKRGKGGAAHEKEARGAVISPVRSPKERLVDTNGLRRGESQGAAGVRETTKGRDISKENRMSGWGGQRSEKLGAAKKP